MKQWERTGANWKAAREGRGLSLAALAGRCVLSVGALAAIERGEVEPSVGVAIKLEDALGMARGSSFSGVRWNQRTLRFEVQPPTVERPR